MCVFCLAAFCLTVRTMPFAFAGTGPYATDCHVVASVSNIVLDLLFVLGFHWGVMGAAVGTVMSQLISALICLRGMLRMPQLRMSQNTSGMDGWRSLLSS